MLHIPRDFLSSRSANDACFYLGDAFFLGDAKT